MRHRVNEVAGQNSYSRATIHSLKTIFWCYSNCKYLFQPGTRFRPGSKVNGTQGKFKHQSQGACLSLLLASSRSHEYTSSTEYLVFAVCGMQCAVCIQPRVLLSVVAGVQMQGFVLTSQKIQKDSSAVLHFRVWEPFYTLFVFPAILVNECFKG